MSRKRCIWRCSWWFTWWCNQGYTFESLHASFISYIEQNKQNCWHSQIRFRSRYSQVYIAVYRKRLIHIFFTKIADQQPEKRLHQRCFPMKLPNISELCFAKHVWVVTASAKYSAPETTLETTYFMLFLKNLTKNLEKKLVIKSVLME